MARMVNCVKLGKEAEGLEFPPVPGELGKRIWENVSKEAWAGWLRHQTMLVNENRLNPADGLSAGASSRSNARPPAGVLLSAAGKARGRNSPCPRRSFETSSFGASM